MSLKPDFGPNNQLLPPLPVIKSFAIRQQVFTHRSFFARRHSVFEDRPDDPSPDNERLEHLGDSVLSLAVTDLMLKLFPGLRVGPSTKTRALIVGNITLADISLKYRLPDRLRLHPAQAITLRASTNVQADVFESFIGGLYLDQGLNTVKSWLDSLFPPYAIAAYDIVRAQHGLAPLSRIPIGVPATGHPADHQLVVKEQVQEQLSATEFGGGLSTGIEPTIGHLALFNQHMQKTRRLVEWDYSDGDVFGLLNTGTDSSDTVKGTKTTPMWTVRAIVDGESLGRGVGNTKKMARNEAAKQGLIKLGIVV